MKFILSFIMVLGLVGCGINCESEPQRQAYMHASGGMGMQYHFSLYDVVGDARHNRLRLKCTKYKYVKTDIYTDSLGEMNIEEVIWIDSQNRTIYPIEESNKIRIYLSKEKIITIGYDYNGDTRGEYKVKASPPK